MVVTCDEFLFLESERKVRYIVLNRILNQGRILTLLPPEFLTLRVSTIRINKQSVSEPWINRLIECIAITNCEVAINII